MAGFLDAFAASPEEVAANPELYNPDGTFRTDKFAGGNLPSPRIAGNLVQVLGRALGFGAKSGELMGAEPALAGSRAGSRTGQTIEGEIVRAALPKPGASPTAGQTPSGAGPMPGAGRPAGGPVPGGKNPMDEWLEALVRERGAGPGVTGTRPGTQGSSQAAGAAEGAGAGGPPGLMDILRSLGSFASRGGSDPSRMRAGLFGAGGLGTLAGMYDGGEAGEPGSLNMPPSVGGELNIGGVGGGGSLNDILAQALGNQMPEVDTQSLPQVDFENLPQIDYEGARAVLEGTAPEAPAERSWMQDLSKWAVPGIAGGILGGPAGIILGALMGEGRRQSDEQLSDKEYQEAMNEFQRMTAQTGLQLDEGVRRDALDTQVGQREQAAGNYDFERGQVEDAQQDVLAQETLDNNALNRILSALDIAQGQNQLSMQNAFLTGSMPQGPDNNEQLLQGLIQSNPAIYNELAQQPLFEEYMLARETKDDIRANAALSAIMQQLQSNPQIAPILDQIRQNTQRMTLFEALK